MPHTPRTKDLAYKIDPNCWISYSGKDVSTKRAMDARRSYALETARKTLADCDEYCRRVNSAQLAFQSGESEFNKIMEGIKMAPTKEEAREALIGVARSIGREEAYTILHRYGVTHFGMVPERCYRGLIQDCDAAKRKKLMNSVPSWATNVSLTLERKPMSILKLQMLLHFSHSQTMFGPESLRTSASYTRFIVELLRDGLVERPSKKERSIHPGWAYKATPRGQFFVKVLTEVPLPVRTNPEWAMPAK